MKDDNHNISEPIFTRKLLDIAHSKGAFEKKCEQLAAVLVDTGFTKESYHEAVRLSFLRHVIRREIAHLVGNPKPEQKKD